MFYCFLELFEELEMYLLLEIICGICFEEQFRIDPICFYFEVPILRWFFFHVPAFAMLQEHYEAVMRRTLERSQRLEQRQKRWSWGGQSPDQDSRAGRDPLCMFVFSLSFIMHPLYNPACSELDFVLHAVGVKWSPEAIGQVSSLPVSVSQGSAPSCVSFCTPPWELYFPTGESDASVSSPVTIVVSSAPPEKPEKSAQGFVC